MQRGDDQTGLCPVGWGGSAEPPPGDAPSPVSVPLQGWVLIFPRGSSYFFLIFPLVSRPKQFHAQLVLRFIMEFTILALRSVL